MNKTYWAAAEQEKIAQEITEKFQSYREWMDKSGYAAKVRQNYQAYYRLNSKGSLALQKNADGSTTHLSVGHYRNLLQHILILTTQNKLTFVARARNTDYSSQVQAQFGSGLIDYYCDEKDLDRVLTRSVEGALVFQESFIETPWDPLQGTDLRPDELDRVIKSGDQSFYTLTPFDVARDPKSKLHKWYITYKPANKHDLAALWPEHADEILNADCQNEAYGLNVDNKIGEVSDDTVWYYTLYHERTPAMPNGRETVVIGKAVLVDQELTYSKAPVHRMSAGDMLETICGHSVGSELLPLNELISKLMSAFATNNLNFAVQNIWSQDPNLSVNAISEGSNLIVSATKPEALQLTSSSAEGYKLVDLLVNHSQLLSGINSVTRGSPEASLKSGTALALMASQAISFTSDLQKSYAKIAGDVGTMVIDNIRRFAKGEMIAAIGGKTRKSYVKSFKAEDLEPVDRLVVEIGNPAAKTFAAQYEMSSQWLSQGQITPQEQLDFLNSGNLDVLLEDSRDQALSIREENEALQLGENPPVILTDDHILHIKKHKSVLNSPEARKDPNLTNAVLAHIQAHIDNMRSMPPDLAAALAGQPLPPPAPPPGPQQAPGAPQGPQMPPGTPPQLEEASNQIGSQ